MLACQWQEVKVPPGQSSQLWAAAYATRKMSAVPSGVTVDGNCATVPCINCSAVPVQSDGRRNRLRGAMGPPIVLDA